MRVLLTTRGSSGHFLPLAPFGHACVRAGHEVLVSAHAANRANVERGGLAVAPVGDPPADEWMPLMGQFGRLSLDEANERMIGDFFAGIDTRATLPGLRAIVEDWRPDIIVRESWEFASTLVAELHDVPIARVGLGLAAVEERAASLAAPFVDQARAALGLPADPAGERMRETPYLTVMPAALEDPAVALPPRTHRFAGEAPAAPAPLGDWWPGNDDPLVYVTLGSVAAGAHMPYYPALYDAVIAELAALPVRILMTIGNDHDPAELGAAAPNVHVERWVAQDDVAPQAAAIVGHGGYGTTLGALRHGVPLLVLPLFSSDQWANAAAVARAGAGLALDAERATRSVLELPGAGTLAELRPAVQRVLAEESFARAARAIASEMRAMAPIDDAVGVLAAIARDPAPRP